MRLFAAAVLAALSPAVGQADTAPPEGAMQLSDVLAALEDREAEGLAFIEDVEWDDDGYWEVEYRGPDGAETKVTLDPMTGEPRD